MRRQQRLRPASPKESGIRLLRSVLLRQRRKRKRRFFRNWFGFKRSWLLRRRLHRRRFFLYWRRRRCFRFFQNRGAVCLAEYKLRLFRRIRRILCAANKNVRHATSFLRIPVSNRNDHKITDCKRQAACQIGAWTSAVLELHLTELVISAAIAHRLSLFIIIRPRLGFFLRFFALVVFFGFFRFFRQTN